MRGHRNNCEDQSSIQVKMPQRQLCGGIGLRQLGYDLAGSRHCVSNCDD